MSQSRDNSGNRSDGPDLSLGRELCARYGDSPGVVRLSGPMSVAPRIERFRAGHLPLLASLNRRWANSFLLPNGWTDPVYAWPSFRGKKMSPRGRRTGAVAASAAVRADTDPLEVGDSVATTGETALGNIAMAPLNDADFAHTAGPAGATLPEMLAAGRTAAMNSAGAPVTVVPAEDSSPDYAPATAGGEVPADGPEMHSSADFAPSTAAHTVPENGPDMDLSSDDRTAEAQIESTSGGGRIENRPSAVVPVVPSRSAASEAARPVLRDAAPKGPAVRMGRPVIQRVTRATDASPAQPSGGGTAKSIQRKLDPSAAADAGSGALPPRPLTAESFRRDAPTHGKVPEIEYRRETVADSPVPAGASETVRPAEAAAEGPSAHQEGAIVPEPQSGQMRPDLHVPPGPPAPHAIEYSSGSLHAKTAGTNREEVILRVQPEGRPGESALVVPSVGDPARPDPAELSVSSRKSVRVSDRDSGSSLQRREEKRAPGGDPTDTPDSSGAGPIVLNDVPAGEGGEATRIAVELGSKDRATPESVEMIQFAPQATSVARGLSAHRPSNPTAVQRRVDSSFATPGDVQTGASLPPMRMAQSLSETQFESEQQSPVLQVAGNAVPLAAVDAAPLTDRVDVSVKRGAAINRAPEDADPSYVASSNPSDATPPVAASTTTADVLRTGSEAQPTLRHPEFSAPTLTFRETGVHQTTAPVEAREGTVRSEEEQANTRSESVTAEQTAVSIRGIEMAAAGDTSAPIIGVEMAAAGHTSAPTIGVETAAAGHTSAPTMQGESAAEDRDATPVVAGERHFGYDSAPERIDRIAVTSAAEERIAEAEPAVIPRQKAAGPFETFRLAAADVARTEVPAPIDRESETEDSGTAAAPDSPGRLVRGENSASAGEPLAAAVQEAPVVRVSPPDARVKRGAPEWAASEASRTALPSLPPDHFAGSAGNETPAQSPVLSSAAPETIAPIDRIHRDPISSGRIANRPSQPAGVMPSQEAAQIERAPVTGPHPITPPITPATDRSSALPGATAVAAQGQSSAGSPGTSSAAPTASGRAVSIQRSLDTPMPGASSGPRVHLSRETAQSRQSFDRPANQNPAPTGHPRSEQSIRPDAAAIPAAADAAGDYRPTMPASVPPTFGEVGSDSLTTVTVRPDDAPHTRVPSTEFLNWRGEDRADASALPSFALTRSSAAAPVEKAEPATIAAGHPAAAPRSAIEYRVADSPITGDRRKPESAPAPAIASASTRPVVAAQSERGSARPPMVHAPQPIQRFSLGESLFSEAAGSARGLASSLGSAAGSALSPMTHLARQAGGLPNRVMEAAQGAFPMGAGAAAPAISAGMSKAGAAGGPGDMSGMVEQVYQMLVRRLDSERQRKGM